MCLNDDATTGEKAIFEKFSIVLLMQLYFSATTWTLGLRLGS